MADSIGRDWLVAYRLALRYTPEFRSRIVIPALWDVVVEYVCIDPCVADFPPCNIDLCAEHPNPRILKRISFKTVSTAFSIKLRAEADMIPSDDGTRQRHHVRVEDWHYDWLKQVLICTDNDNELSHWLYELRGFHQYEEDDMMIADINDLLPVLRDQLFRQVKCACTLR
jgi:hypothetical protein